MDLLKLVLRKSLSPTQNAENDSFYFTFADCYNDVSIIDNYDSIELSILKKWHGYRSSFKEDLFMDGYTADLCAPRETNGCKYIKSIVEAVNSGNVEKYSDHEFYAVFYNIADDKIKEFVKDNMGKPNQETVENYYDWVDGFIQTKFKEQKENSKFSSDCGCAVYLSFGSSEAVAVYYVKRGTAERKDIDDWIDGVRRQVGINSGFLEQRILMIKKGDGSSQENNVELTDYADDNARKDDDGECDERASWNKTRRVFNDAYTKLAHGDHKAHCRVQNAMNDILNIYEQISQSEHSRDIVATLGAFLKCFLSSLTKIIDSINCGKDGVAQNTIYKNDGEPVSINEYSSFVEGSICAVRDVLSPLWHSEHAIYDDQRPIRHAVGGLIKLLYAYNDMLFMWNDIYSNENEKDPVMNFATSGGVDIITNQDLFNYNQSILKTDNKPIERPIAVTVPEASLWDITGSIYRIAHEFFHVRGEKCREARAEMYLDGLFDIFAEYCYDTVIEEILRIKAKNLFDNLIMQTELKSEYSRFDKSAAFEKFLEDVESYGDRSYTFVGSTAEKRFIDTIKSIRGLLKRLRDELKNGINGDIRNTYVESVVKYIKAVCEKDLGADADQIIKYGPYLIELRYKAPVLFAKAMEIVVKGIDHDVSGNIADNCSDRGVATVDNHALMTEVARAMNSIDGTTDAPYSLYDIVFSSTSVKPHVATIYKHAIENYFDNDGNSAQTARYLIEKVMPGLYKECVADCLAIMSSGLNEAKNGFIRYILCMLYEKRSLVEFFYNAPEQYDLFMILRLGVVKDVCGLQYDNSTAEEYIKRFYREIMFPHLDKKDANEAGAYAVALNDHIRSINGKYEKYKDRGFIVGLKNYLKKCVDANREKCNEIKQKIGYDVKDIENEINGNEYVNFAFAHWLRLYGDRK